jgi:Flp pilus assembly pilin Flp
MKQLLTRLLKEEQGQDVIEYGLLAAGISIVAIPSVPTVGGWVKTKWEAIATELK